ncbi:protein-tyrosine phosphatase-like protein [Flagelloscypha sp. PMI_526]|nr:protein-tyrosine phosphatase-like protein [Flagelloscypha sp. PMI_526]
MLSFPTPSWQPQPKAAKRNPLKSVAAGRAASEILPRLYLSDYYTARNVETMNRLGVTHIITLLEPEKVQEDPVLAEKLVKEENRLRIEIADRSDVDILSWLEKTTEFIGNALRDDEKNVVLVHCLQGISRSATVVCAYVVSVTGKSGTEAIEYVQAKRGIICPNLGFRQQLDQYADKFVGGKRPGGRIVGHKKVLSAGIASRIKLFKSSTASSPPAESVQ